MIGSIVNLYELIDLHEQHPEYTLCSIVHKHSEILHMLQQNHVGKPIEWYAELSLMRIQNLIKCGYNFNKHDNG